ncbi:MAG: hypothetical protein RMI56_04375 [Sulfolobales archaeon]|nr:hypothetical protein [Sulfolobales archaeon]MDW8083019.1 hypothetical protein [Sulfolobales archaeon]
MKCLDKHIEYYGASIKISITTLTEAACGEILDIEDFSKMFEVVRKHGGCRITSEDPLKVASVDGEIEISAEPENLLARAYLGIALEKLKKLCEARS